MGQSTTIVIDKGIALTCLTGRVFCNHSELMKTVRAIFTVPIYIHQLPDACDLVRTVLLEQYPELRFIDSSLVDSNSARGWGLRTLSTMPDTYAVPLLDAFAGRFSDPEADLEKRFGDKIVVLDRTRKDT